MALCHKLRLPQRHFLLVFCSAPTLELWSMKPACNHGSPSTLNLSCSPVTLGGKKPDTRHQLEPCAVCSVPKLQPSSGPPQDFQGTPHRHTFPVCLQTRRRNPRSAAPGFQSPHAKTTLYPLGGLVQLYQVTRHTPPVSSLFDLHLLPVQRSSPPALDPKHGYLSVGICKKSR